MSKTIWKFSVEPSPNPTTVKAPGLGTPLMFGTQGSLWMVWCEVDPEKPMWAKEFLVVGTGHPMPSDNEGYTHVNSWQDGPFVFHGYYRPASVD